MCLCGSNGSFPAAGEERLGKISIAKVVADPAAAFPLSKIVHLSILLRGNEGSPIRRQSFGPIVPMIGPIVSHDRPLAPLIGPIVPLDFKGRRTLANFRLNFEIFEWGGQEGEGREGGASISSFPASFSTHTHTASGHTYVHIHFGLEKFHGFLFNNLFFWDGSINVIRPRGENVDLDTC